MPEVSNAPVTIVYTDGACSGNPGPGGWAWAIENGRFESGAESHTTNQRMEIKAAFEAVRSLPGRLEVVSDSAYVGNCFKQRWWEQLSVRLTPDPWVRGACANSRNSAHSRMRELVRPRQRYPGFTAGPCRGDPRGLAVIQARWNPTYVFNDRAGSSRPAARG